MQKFFKSVAIFAVLVVAGMGLYRLMTQPLTQSSGNTAQRETAFDRIKRTGTIRCGYVVWNPLLLRDANTGAMSGLAYEYMEAIAHELGFKVEWTQEVGWGDYHEALNTNKIDMMCVPVWQSGARARVSLLTQGLYYDALVAFAREDDRRFDAGLPSLNKPDVRVVVIDGDAPQSARRKLFPLSQELALPQSADMVQQIMSVAMKKADIVLDNFDNVQRFNSGSGAKLRPVAGGQPVQIFANVLSVRPGETDLKAALDAVIELLNNDGTAAAIIKKYGPNFRPPAPTYLK
ncbi:MAG: transporter substrate-binding domain-containing protein [Alphaproteobacteria bacterium]|nr:transporter substrate-binding domain-containing protein [Alphaproteobacteria bacterium]